MLAIHVTSDKMKLDPDAARLWNKYCLCRKPSYMEYDKMSYKEREQMGRIDRAISEKKASLRRLANG